MQSSPVLQETCFVGVMAFSVVSLATFTVRNLQHNLSRLQVKAAVTAGRP